MVPLTDVCGPGNGTLSGSAGDTLLTASDITLVPGQVWTFSVVLDVPVSAAAGKYTNTNSAVGATVLGLPVTGNPATDDLQIGGLVLTKEFIDDPGGSCTFDVTVKIPVTAVAGDYENITSSLILDTIAVADPATAPLTIGDETSNGSPASGYNLDITLPQPDLFN